MWLRRSWCLWLVGLAAVAGGSCGRGGSDKRDECAPIRADPATAMADLGKRLPPLEVAKTLERCVAPTGDHCERVAAIVRAIPSFVPTLGPKPDRALEACRSAPPELQPCLLPSYVLEHADECKALIERLSDTVTRQIEIPPAGPGSGVVPGGSCKPAEVALEVSARGVKVKPSYSAAWNGPLAIEKLEAELAGIRGDADCRGLATITMAADASYQHVITAMDVADRAGFESDIDVGNPRKRPAPATPPDPDGKSELQKAPVVIVTTTEVRMRDKLIAARDDSGLAAALATALRAEQKATPARLLILQADKDTPTTVIKTIVSTSTDAGYDSVMFAVKNR